MGDSKRFKVFSIEIFKKFPPKYFNRVADIAGGKGHLNYELKQKGYKVTTFDKRNNNRSGVTFVKKYFNDKVKSIFNLLTGMHPDEATDIIISEAAKRKIPFVIVPCCTMPIVSKYYGNLSYQSWVHDLDMYARKIGFITQKKQINITGKNIMIWGSFKPKTF